MFIIFSFFYLTLNLLNERGRGENNENAKKWVNLLDCTKPKKKILLYLKFDKLYRGICGRNNLLIWWNGQSSVQNETVECSSWDIANLFTSLGERKKNDRFCVFTHTPQTYRQGSSLTIYRQTTPLMHINSRQNDTKLFSRSFFVSLY